MGGEVRSPVNNLADQPLTSSTTDEEGRRMRGGISSFSLLFQLML